MICRTRLAFLRAVSRVGLTVYAMGGLTVPLAMAAQDKDPIRLLSVPGVVVDRSVLDEYAPPPMFGSQALRPQQDLSAAPSTAGATVSPPFPPRKPVLAHQEIVASVPPVPSRKPTTPKSAAPVRKTPAPVSSAMTIPVPAQINVPAMPAVPAGRVDTVILQEHPDMPRRDARRLHVRDESAHAGLIGTKVTGAESLLNLVETAAGSPGIQTFSIPFARGASALAPENLVYLQTKVLSALHKSPQERIRVQAYAAPDPAPGGARRISLSRAMAVRNYLLANGLSEDKIDVRAFGSDTTRPPHDRVDLILTRESVR